MKRTTRRLLMLVTLGLALVSLYFGNYVGIPGDPVFIRIRDLHRIAILLLTAVSVVIILWITRGRDGT